MFSFNPNPETRLTLHLWLRYGLFLAQLQWAVRQLITNIIFSIAKFNETLSFVGIETSAPYFIRTRIKVNVKRNILLNLVAQLDFSLTVFGTRSDKNDVSNRCGSLRWMNCANRHRIVWEERARIIHSFIGVCPLFLNSKPCTTSRN